MKMRKSVRGITAVMAASIILMTSISEALPYNVFAGEITSDAAENISENSASEGTSSENKISDRTSSQNTVSENAGPENAGNDGQVSGDDIQEKQVSCDAAVLTADTDGVRITVTADAGVFPDGVTLEAKKVTAVTELEKIENAVSKISDAVNSDDEMMTFDITVRDKDGNEVEPDSSKGKVTVTFGCMTEADTDTENSADKENGIQIFHMDDVDSEAKELDTSEDMQNGTVTAQTDHFSLFTIVLKAGGNTVTLDAPLTINSGNLNTYEGCTISGSISGARKEYLTVDGVTVDLTIKDLAIAMDTGFYAQYSGMVLKNNAVVNLTVLGTNSFTASFGGAGIAVPEGCTLKITKESTGTLTACGGNYYGGGAGIGAVSNGYNPPSSGGNTQSVGTIEIDGGTVTAAGGTASVYSEKLGAAGIGGSMDSITGKIIITGGTVTASGGGSAAAIGGGFCGQVNEIDISGGQITATAGKNGGSAIGSGVSQAASASDAIGCGAINVTGGKISAYGNIGYGKDYTITQFYNGGSITISDEADVAIYDSGVIYPASNQDQNGFYDLRFTIYDEDITKNCPVTVKFSGNEYSAELSVSGYTGQLSGKYSAAKGLSGKKRVSIVSDTKQWDFDIDFVDGTTGYSATVGKIYTYSAVISDARLVSDGTTEVTIAGRTYQAAMTVTDHKGTLSGKFVRYEDISESQNVKMVMNGITWQQTVSRSGNSYTVTIGTRICPVYLWFYDPGITADRTGVTVSVSRDGTEFGAGEMITDTKIEKTADGIGKMSLWMMEGSDTDITVSGSGLNGNSPVKLTAQTIVNKSGGNNLIMWDKSEVSVQVTTMDLSYGDISITEYAGKLKFTYYTDAQTQKTVTGQLCDSEYEIMQSNSTTATDHTISISGTASGTLKLKLNGVNISTSTDRSPIDITDNAKVDLILCGTNMTVYNSNGLDTPSIHVAPLSELDIEGTGSIDTGNNRGISKGYYSAGIGGRANEGCGSIEIKSGTVKAYGGEGAGIGSGKGATSDSGQIRISGGCITAGYIQTNADYGICCIGRGWTSNTNGAAPDVIITGGTFNLNGYNKIYGNTPENVKYTAGDTVTIDGAAWNVDGQTPDSSGKITIWLKNGTNHTIVSGSHTYDFVWKNSCFVPGNRVRITKDPEEEIDLPKGYSYTALPMVSIKAEKTENASDSDVITYQWYENGNIINNATGDLYYVPYKGVGKYVFTCRVTCGDTVIDSKEGIIRIYVNQGSCYLTMENWTYGDTPADPDSRSDTNTGVTPVYKYKTADADDSAYAAVADLSTLSAGRYSVRVVYPSTDDYSMATDEAVFIVQQRPLDTSMISAGTGYSKSPAVTVSCSGKTLTEGTDYTVSYDSTAEGDVPVTVEGMGNYTGTASVTAKIDRTSPSFDGDDCGISFADNQWKQLLSQVTFGFFTKTKDITVKAADSISGIDKYFYYIDKTSEQTALSTSQLETKSFIEDGDGKFTLDPDVQCVIYAYAVDRAGNRSGYICSQGVTVDNTAPLLTVAEPSGDDIRDVSAVLKINAGETGTVYYIVRTSEEQPATADKISGAQDKHKLNVTAGSQVSDTMSGLMQNTIYHVYAYATDRAGNESAVSSCIFRTAKDAVKGSMDITGTLASGQQITAAAAVTSADPGYAVYKWYRSEDRDNWNVISGADKSQYTLTAADAGNYIKAAAFYDNYSGSLENTTDKKVMPLIGGTVSLNGAAIYGNQITAAVTGGENGALYTYSFIRNGLNIPVQSSSSAVYTLTKYDIGKTISVKVTAAGDYGTIESAATAPVAKAAGSAVQAVVGNMIHDGSRYTYTEDALQGAEYAEDEGAWQDSPVFAGIAQGSQHTFRARMKETDCFYAGTEAVSGTVIFKQITAAPVISPAGGTYSQNVKVDVTCATEGAEIYYTTDGSMPSVSGQTSKKYTVSFNAAPGTTVKAFAVKDGMSDSIVAAAVFNSQTENSSSAGRKNSDNENTSDSSDGKEAGGGSDSSIQNRPDIQQPEVIVPAHAGKTDGNIDRKNTEYNKKDIKVQPEQPSIISSDANATGWEAIEKQIENTDSGKNLTVEMNGTGTVPGKLFESIRGRDVTITFNMGNGIAWTVNGKNISSEHINDIDFSVTKNSDTIPADVINKVTGERYSVNISIAYSGKFGFTATLSVDLDSSNEGLYANLFYYNPETNSLDFMTSGKIDSQGKVQLELTHASDYTIVIDKKPMNAATSGVKGITKKSGRNTDAVKSYKWFECGILIVLFAVAVMTVFEIRIKFKKMN